MENEPGAESIWIILLDFSPHKLGKNMFTSLSPNSALCLFFFLMGKKNSLLTITLLCRYKHFLQNTLN